MIEIVNYHVSVCTSLAVKPLAPLVQKFVLKKKKNFFIVFQYYAIQFLAEKADFTKDH